MNQHLVDAINEGYDGQIYASSITGGRVTLERIGFHQEVRHMFNQIACLLAANAMLMRIHKGYSSEEWRDSYGDGQPVGTAEELFAMATEPPSDRMDAIGFLVSHSVWPSGTDRLSGMSMPIKAIAEMSSVLYSFKFWPSATVGCSAHRSLAKRVNESIAVAKKLGYSPYDEDALIKFSDKLVSAKALHFFHDVYVS